MISHLPPAWIGLGPSSAVDEAEADVGVVVSLGFIVMVGIVISDFIAKVGIAISDGFFVRVGIIISDGFIVSDGMVISDDFIERDGMDIAVHFIVSVGMVTFVDSIVSVGMDIVADFIDKKGIDMVPFMVSLYRLSPSSSSIIRALQGHDPPLVSFFITRVGMAMVMFLALSPSSSSMSMSWPPHDPPLVALGCMKSVGIGIPVAVALTFLGSPVLSPSSWPQINGASEHPPGLLVVDTVLVAPPVTSQPTIVETVFAQLEVCVPLMLSVPTRQDENVE